MNFPERLRAAAERTDAVLSAVLTDLAEKDHAPDRLLMATRHALLAGGKRFRPFLVMECAALVGSNDTAAAQVGAGFECLHAYSLVHDDLPAMDDDDMRRGQPTVHKAFDEATAILVGDGLQALAFQLLATAPVPASAAVELLQVLARGSGFEGMVGGQYRDLNATGFDADGVRQMQAMKTGALITGACEAGAVVGGASPAAQHALTRYGELLGLAFQLSDDLLDIEGSAEEVGKRVGKDADEGKVTLAGLLGIDEAKSMLEETVVQAASCLDMFGDEGAILRHACRFVADRRS